MHEPARFQSQAYLSVLSPTASSLRCGCHQTEFAAMHRAAEQAYPQEACGLLIGRLDAEGWQVLEARQVANINTERAADRFQLDPDAYRRIDRELRGSDREIIGVFHSHPDCPAKPSPTDLASAWEGFIYPIIRVEQGRATEVNWWALGPDTRFQPVPLLEEKS
jgi:proteasome lid subunit RPN8/RPN11